MAVDHRLTPAMIRLLTAAVISCTHATPAAGTDHCPAEGFLGARDTRGTLCLLPVRPQQKKGCNYNHSQKKQETQPA